MNELELQINHALAHQGVPETYEAAIIQRYDAFRDYLAAEDWVAADTPVLTTVTRDTVRGKVVFFHDPMQFPERLQIYAVCVVHVPLTIPDALRDTTLTAAQIEQMASTPDVFTVERHT